MAILFPASPVNRYQSSFHALRLSDFFVSLLNPAARISATQGAVIRTRVLIVSICGRQEKKDILHFIMIAGEICRVFTDRSKR